MPTERPDPETLDTLYRTESRRILATLIRLLGDFDLAEEAMHDAFQAALEQWPTQGLPDQPRAWLVATGRFKGIDAIRRRAKYLASLDEVQLPAAPEAVPEAEGPLQDDRLRLVFTCCHPALGAEARAALTLREVCGLTTEAIARAYLVAPATLAQRIVRAKAKIREARIPYEIPSAADLPERLDTVLEVVYLLFNEGYSACSGDSLTRADLSSEAIRLGRLLLDLLPETEVRGLLALLLLQESRRDARTTPAGDLVLLADQDRGRWRKDYIEEGAMLAAQAWRSRRAGRYTLQAAIAAVHAQAASAEGTDWDRIVHLYDLLARIDPSPVIALNRAVAVAMRDGPGAGLVLIDRILGQGDLAQYHLAHSARADLCRRQGRIDEARASYRAALALARQEPERRFLERRLQELG